MSRVVLVLTAAVVLSTGGAVSAQDNPVLREYLSRAAKKGLAKHNSEVSAWYSEKSENKKKWAEVKNPVTGKVVAKTLVAEWTEESKTWLWLDNPDKNLNINITKFELMDGMLNFGVTATGKAKGKAWGKIPNVVTADVKSSANVEITIEGKAKINDGKFTDVEVSKLSGQLSDLRFNNDALNAVRDLAKDCANEYIKFKNDDLKEDMKKSIEGFRP